MGCAFYREDDEIVFSIEWNGQTESFTLLMSDWISVPSPDSNHDDHDDTNSSQGTTTSTQTAESSRTTEDRDQRFVQQNFNRFRLIF
ncbi:hypothetical protein J2S00_001237 [Caldalkalibacillus uzonensis]|uniref:Uncharacterized protein n=1 Tax=Caldalkalibacillus uzonensis TaxID=353224 RepID=A0ABU0CPW8_9BACI|nr:hypothetical protein [Caldalkalibacillus uzonensis]MDQ0338453.1 hypothetical protein [Caldalkalibacillus uzonensis]